MVQHHALLRTEFVWGDLKEPNQIVRTVAEPEFMEYDWSGKLLLDICLKQPRTYLILIQFLGLWPTELILKMKSFLLEDRLRGFDISKAPLIRMALIHLPNGANRVLISDHHIVLDGWSSQTILKDLFMCYVQLCAGQMVPSPVWIVAF